MNSKLTRFGRKLALPSTRQIIHELRAMMAADVKALQPELGKDAGSEKALATKPDDKAQGK